MGKLLLSPTKTFSPGWTSPIPHPLLPGPALQSPDLLHGPPLNFPSSPTSSCTTSLKTGCSVLNAAKEAMSPLICWLRLLLVQPRMLLVFFAARVHVFGSCSPGCLQTPPGLFSRAAPQTVSPQHVPLQGILPSQMQDFVHFKFHKGPCQPVPPAFETPLDGSSLVKGCHKQIC